MAALMQMTATRLQTADLPGGFPEFKTGRIPNEIAAGFVCLLDSG
jgi:hypothetical protein